MLYEKYFVFYQPQQELSLTLELVLEILKQQSSQIAWKRKEIIIPMSNENAPPAKMTISF